MSLPTTLRMLVLLELGCLLMAGVTGLVREASLPEPLRSYSESIGGDDLTGNELALVAVGVPLMLAMVGASVGLLASWRPARSVYVATRVASVAIQPLFGPYVDDGWSEMFDTAAFMTAGVILGILWWSPLAAIFSGDHRPA